MSRFEWRMTVVDKMGIPRHSFLHIKDNTLLFWGILFPDIDEIFYSPYIFKPDRTGYITIKEKLSLQDAKDAVENKLFDDGIIQEGDEVVDDTK